MKLQCCVTYIFSTEEGSLTVLYNLYNFKYHLHTVSTYISLFTYK